LHGQEVRAWSKEPGDDNVTLNTDLAPDKGWITIIGVETSPNVMSHSSGESV
jgi:hypothetical protein